MADVKSKVSKLDLDSAFWITSNISTEYVRDIGCVGRSIELP